MFTFVVCGKPFSLLMLAIYCPLPAVNVDSCYIACPYRIILIKVESLTIRSTDVHVYDRKTKWNCRMFN